MARWIAGIFLLLLLVAGPLLGIGAQQRQPAQTGPTLVTPGASLAGIRLEESILRILARFGVPSEIRTVGQDQLYIFWRYGITVYVRDGAATGISTTNSLLRTREDIGVGSRIEEVTATFGTNFVNTAVEGYRGIAYPHLGIAFGLENQTVVVVYVFRPQAAASTGGGGTTTESAQQNPAASSAPQLTYPDVSKLRPFTPETKNLSLPGYLRYLVYQQTGLWISYGDAVRIVKEQLARTEGK